MRKLLFRYPNVSFRQSDGEYRVEIPIKNPINSTFSFCTNFSPLSEGLSTCHLPGKFSSVICNLTKSIEHWREKIGTAVEKNGLWCYMDDKMTGSISSFEIDRKVRQANLTFDNIIHISISKSGFSSTLNMPKPLQLLPELFTRDELKFEVKENENDSNLSTLR